MHRGVSLTSKIQVGVRMKSSHSFWAKYQEASKDIDLHGLFSDYWGSKDYEFTILSQSAITKQSAES